MIRHSWPDTVHWCVDGLLFCYRTWYMRTVFSHLDRWTLSYSTSYQQRPISLMYGFVYCYWLTNSVFECISAWCRWDKCSCASCFLIWWRSECYFSGVDVCWQRSYIFAFVLSSRLFLLPHQLMNQVCQVCMVSRMTPSILLAILILYVSLFLL